MELDRELVRGGYDAYLNDRCVCQYCGFDGKRSPEDWAQLQIDHLIPRGLAGEHRDEPLNRVVACYYCNTQKRNFDPTGGKLTRVSSEEERKELIEIVREFLTEKKEKMWGYGGGFERSYLHMMESIENYEA